MLALRFSGLPGVQTQVTPSYCVLNSVFLPYSVALESDRIFYNSLFRYSCELKDNMLLLLSKFFPPPSQPTPAKKKVKTELKL